MVYLYHLRKTLTQLNKYNNQIGGLALAAAAVSKPITFYKYIVMPIFIQVKRSLRLFASGKDVLTSGAQDINGSTSPFLNGHGLSFTENPWGTKAHDFVSSTKKLKDSHWADITHDISKLKLLGHDWQHTEVNSDEDDNGDGNTRQVNPRARIDIDW